MEQQIIQYLLNPGLIPEPYSQLIFTLKIIFVLISIIFLGIIFYTIVSTNWLKYRAIEDIDEFIKFQPYGSDKYVKEWKKVKKRLDTGIEAEYKLAIIEIDTMLGEILKRMGYDDETIEKRLNKVTSIEISNIDALKEARKVRNGVIHDPDYQLSKEKAKEVMDVYQESFRSLGILV